MATGAGAEGVGVLIETAAGEAAGSMFGTAGEATETTGVLRDGGVRGAEETTMAGTLPELFFSSGAPGCCASWPVSTGTVATVWGWTLAGV